MNIKLDDHVELLDHPYEDLGKYGRVVQIIESEETRFRVDVNDKDGDQNIYTFYSEEIKLSVVEAD